VFLCIEQVKFGSIPAAFPEEVRVLIPSRRKEAKGVRLLGGGCAKIEQ
jgi:hypothetical protein